MASAAVRWLMTSPGAPLVKAEFKPSPGPHEVVVEIAGCGVCHTDLGYYYDGVRTNHPLPLGLHHVAADLMAEAKRQRRIGAHSVVVVAEIGVTHAAAGDLDRHFVRTGMTDVELHRHQRLTGGRHHPANR